jgi:hypothetical protein
MPLDVAYHQAIPKKIIYLVSHIGQNVRDTTIAERQVERMILLAEVTLYSQQKEYQDASVFIICESLNL